MIRSIYSLLLLAVAALPLAAIDDPIRTHSGLLAGAAATTPDIRVYKGIPYAAPPVGAMRWKAPQPAAKWQGVREAKDFGAACMQQPYPETSIYYSKLGQISEDCLTLNIWTGAKSATERRPVMVWIHGGALTRGSGATPTYDGESLAKKGVVLVTINYRLGIFGFFAHPALTAESEHHSSGNYGLLDQIAALQWVRNNIAAFGGDPTRVTILGESAGSWSVNYLMASPLAKGLFQRVIGESGASFRQVRRLQDAEKAGKDFGADLNSLRAEPAEKLLSAAPASRAFGPCVDGWMLPQDIYTIFAEGRQNDVPLIAGSNSDEATTLSPWPPNATAQSFVSQATQRFGKFADEFLKEYPAASDREAEASHYASFRDLTFGWEMRTWVRMASRTGHSPAYLYYFSHVPPGPGSARLRAYHAAEIAYAFNNVHLSKRPMQDADRRLADLMSSYWVNFAATGNPNGAGLPKWPQYDVKTDFALEFGDAVELRSRINASALDFLDRYNQAQRSGN
jgi:para-nitrobenzyl esterase